MATDDRTALRKAAEIIARQAKAIAVRFSTRIPASTRVTVSTGYAEISSGGPAIFFETPNSRHPLFATGPKGTGRWKYWYKQPYRPFLEQAAEAQGEAAMQQYADVMFEQFCRKYGYRLWLV